MDRRAQIFGRLVDEAASTKEKLFLAAVWLFSSKGYDKVGIRELCAAVGIKEASFYNHYRGKDALLQAICDYFIEYNQRTVISDAELDSVTAEGDVWQFFEWMMRRFGAITDHPVFHAVLQIIRMESFTNPAIGQVARTNLYHVRRECTVKGLRRLQADGRVRDCDLEQAVASYYYGLIGLLDEYVLLQLWDGDAAVQVSRIRRHMDLFIAYLDGSTRMDRGTGGQTI